MSKPRRYVQVQCLRGYPVHDGNGQVHRPRFSRWECSVCSDRSRSFRVDFPHAIAEADRHARTCPAVAAAMERDQLRAELDRMRADRNRLRDRLHTAINFNLKDTTP